MGLNSVIKQITERAPRAGLPLLSGRVGLKHKLGVAKTDALKSNALVNPVAEELMNDMLSCAGVALENVLPQEDRWAPPITTPTSALPTRADMNTKFPRVDPAMMPTPATLWATPYNLIVHHHFAKPTLDECVCFGPLEAAARVALCVDKLRSLSMVAVYCVTLDSGEYFISTKNAMESHTMLEEIAMRYSLINNPTSTTIDATIYKLDWSEWCVTGRAHIIEPASKLLLQLKARAPTRAGKRKHDAHQPHRPHQPLRDGGSGNDEGMATAGEAVDELAEDLERIMEDAATENGGLRLGDRVAAAIGRAGAADVMLPLSWSNALLVSTLSTLRRAM